MDENSGEKCVHGMTKTKVILSHKKQKEKRTSKSKKKTKKRKLVSTAGNLKKYKKVPKIKKTKSKNRSKSRSRKLRSRYESTPENLKNKSIADSELFENSQSKFIHSLYGSPDGIPRMPRKYSENLPTTKKRSISIKRRDSKLIKSNKLKLRSKHKKHRKGSSASKG